MMEITTQWRGNPVFRGNAFRANFDHLEIGFLEVQFIAGRDGEIIGTGRAFVPLGFDSPGSNFTGAMWTAMILWESTRD